MIPQKIFDDIKVFLDRLLSLHKTATENKDDNGVYLSLAKDKDECEDITELCEETDFYYEERKKLNDSKLEAYRYLEQRSIELYKKEENTETSEEECQQFLDDIRESLDDAILSNTYAFSYEVDDVKSDENEQLDKFCELLEKKINSGEEQMLPKQENEGRKEGNE